MSKKRNWLIVTASFICLLVVPTASSETVVQDAFTGKPALDERYEDVDDSWVSTDIEGMLNIYGPTSAGNASSNTNNLPYEEMGVYGVEYENLFLERYLKEVDESLLNTGKKDTTSDTDKTN
jgi:hypothetical protein